MDLRKAPQTIPATIRTVAFDFYSPDEIRALSVKEITKPISFDALSNPEVNGLYDPALGPVDRHAVCPTCHLTQRECPGHLGHHELAEPLYHPLMMPQPLDLLQLPPPEGDAPGDAGRRHRARAA